MRYSIIFVIFVFCVLALACAGETASTRADSTRIQSALRSSTRSLGLQTQLPVEAGKKITAEENLLDRLTSRRILLTSNVAGMLFFISLAAIAAVIFMTWRDNMWSLSRERRFERSDDESATAAEVTVRMEKAQVEADELARRGDFAEAMHILLLRSLDELRRHLGVSIAVSLTSREILRHVSLPSEGRSVFADIIDRVELSYFGGRRPGADEYTACRGSFDALTDVLRRYSAHSGSFLAT